MNKLWAYLEDQTEVGKFPTEMLLIFREMMERLKELDRDAERERLLMDLRAILEDDSPND